MPVLTPWEPQQISSKVKIFLIIDGIIEVGISSFYV